MPITSKVVTEVIVYGNCDFCSQELDPSNVFVGEISLKKLNARGRAKTTQIVLDPVCAANFQRQPAATRTRGPRKPKDETPAKAAAKRPARRKSKQSA